MKSCKQFEVWIADLSPRFGTEPGKVRPVVIVQTDLFCSSSILLLYGSDLFQLVKDFQNRRTEELMNIEQKKWQKKDLWGKLNLPESRQARGAMKKYLCDGFEP